MCKKIENIPSIFFDKLTEKLKVYFIIGGMPEAVASWVKDIDIEKVNNLKVYNEINKPKTRIRFSMKDLNKDDKINIPLFMVEYLDKLLNL